MQLRGAGRALHDIRQQKKRVYVMLLSSMMKI